MPSEGAEGQSAHSYIVTEQPICLCLTMKLFYSQVPAVDVIACNQGCIYRPGILSLRHGTLSNICINVTANFMMNIYCSSLLGYTKYCMSAYLQEAGTDQDVCVYMLHASARVHVHQAHEFCFTSA
jgi:hypothetical protein